MTAQTTPRTCIDRVLPDELQGIAVRKALKENEANRPAPGEVEPGFEAAVVTGKLWRPGRTLRVAFLDGVSDVQAGVRRFAEEWSQHANIGFDWVTAPEAEIRISFAQNGSWSALGTDALVEQYFRPGEPTMNYGWLNRGSSDEEISSVVLHEFGHALGMIHEHQNPAASIRWNKEVVYRDLGGPPNLWSPAQVDHNVFNTYDSGLTNFTSFDPESIMLYFFPPEWTLDGQTFEENHVLSQNDKRLMSEMYPRLVAKT